MLAENTRYGSERKKTRKQAEEAMERLHQKRPEREKVKWRGGGSYTLLKKTSKEQQPHINKEAEDH